MSTQFDGFAKPALNIFKLGAPGDFIQGTLVEVGDFSGEYGDTKSFKVKADKGEFHNIEDGVVSKEATALNEGTIYSFLGKPIFMDDLLQAEIGQKVVVVYKEDRKNQKGRGYKYIEALLGEMDEAVVADKLDEVVKEIQDQLKEDTEEELI